MIFTAVFTPAGVPAPLIDHHNAAIVRVVRSADFSDKLAALGISATPSTPAELARRVQDTHVAWSTMVKNAGYQAQ
ncbi:hypothetical protein O4H66_18375 [Comamonadaceae bacterium G21597-S1]|nr:hypothetical protein [Comamonadaceae bacterium G21597-S1]